jgi:hypothetical protein
MPNPKTSANAPKPVAQNGWVNKCDLDDYLDRHLPIPTRAVSNEEYYPLPQTAEQKAVEQRLLEMAEGSAKRVGMDRRIFLRTNCGMATAFAAMNAVFDPYFSVDAAELGGARWKRRVESRLLHLRRPDAPRGIREVAAPRGEFTGLPPRRPHLESGTQKKRP